VNYNTMPAPFVVQPTLTSITIAYSNGKLIADDVMPRVPVDKQDFKYTKYTKEDTFTVPDTKVGRLSKPNQVDWSASEALASTRDYGLETGIPMADILAAQGTPVSPEQRATEQLTDLVLLDREIRVSNLVFNAASYNANNKVTLAGVTQWSDYTNSNPISAILTACDAMLVRPNVLVLSRAVWTVISQHPKIVAAAFPLGGNASVGGGYVSREALANLLELDEIIVGEGWVNTAKKGQAPNIVRVWGKHAALIYRNALTQDTKGMSFGVTAQWGERIAGTMTDPDMGLRGGVKVRIGESVKEVILADDLGYFFQNAVA
jgi:hypothetical protein